MAKMELAVAEQIWHLISGRTGNMGRVDFFPQKPAFEASRGKEQPLERATPESQGIDSQYLAAFLTELAEDREMDIHQVMAARHGKVICECGYAPYPSGMWHATYSLCKSIVGMAVGMLADEGKLQVTDRVIDFFSGRKNLLNMIRLKDVTVEHLLTMTSCVNFNETGIVTGNDWVRGFLEASVNGTPGRDFHYNSMNTYMLSAIVTELTGQTLMEYLTPRLWEPLGIERVFWETCPMGITKGGWGLFLRPEDALKLGLLYLNKGSWEGRQLLDPAWVENSCRLHAETPAFMSSNGYGYQMWMGGREGAFNYNGMLGQNVVVYPDLDMVLVTNAGTGELFQSCALMDVVRKYFELDFKPPQTLPENPEARQKLANRIALLEGRAGGFPVILGGGWNRRRRLPAGSRQCPDAGKRLNGKVYEMEDGHVGLMPLLMQVMHNNYTDGIRKIGFEMYGKQLFITLYEGEEEYRIPIGFGRAAVWDISFHGEVYRLGVEGRFSDDEEGRTVLILDFAFLEEACRRKLKLYFEGQWLEARWDETPGKDVILEGLDSFSNTEDRMGFVMNAVKESGGMDVFHILVEHTVRPVCRGYLLPSTREAVSEEEQES